MCYLCNVESRAISEIRVIFFLISNNAFNTLLYNGILYNSLKVRLVFLILYHHEVN